MNQTIRILGKNHISDFNVFDILLPFISYKLDLGTVNFMSISVPLHCVMWATSLKRYLTYLCQLVVTRFIGLHNNYRGL